MPKANDDALAAGCATLVDVLRHRAALAPARVAYRFLPGNGAAELQVDYGTLDAQSRAIAARLQSVAQPGDRAVLLFQPGLDYVAAFFGCLYAGVTAVPAYPPHPRRADPRVLGILTDSGATVALTTRTLRERIAQVDGAPSTLRWIVTDEQEQGASAAWDEPSLRPDSLAMLQYTSGSTAAPRGVMLTHANLLHNLALVRDTFAHTPDDVGVIWLPPFHDMGLIGGILEPCYVGFPVVLMPPASFLQRPVSWLEAISEYRATGSGAPNFAYDLCVERVSDVEKRALDLTRWRTAFNGAEPIRAETLARFSHAFAESGFSADAIFPCYGLAEATLLVSGGPAGRGARSTDVSRTALAQHEVQQPVAAEDATRLTASGGLVTGQEVAIVDPDRLVRCGAREVGEIWVRGPSVAKGYWRREEESAETFGARIRGEDGSYLRTGDLGFLLDGQLVVTGRRKDLVIVAGRNIYPQDVELVASRSHPSLRPGYAAAFAVEASAGERLLLVLEVTRRHDAAEDDAVFAAVREATARELGVVPDAIVLVRQHGIPRTSSGKVQRRATRDALRAGTLPVVARRDEPELRAETLRATASRLSALRPDDTASVTGWLVQWVADELRVPRESVDPRAALQEFGLDSMAALRMVVAVERELAVRLDLDALWRQPNLEAIAALLSRGVATEGGVPHEGCDDLEAFPEVRELAARLEALDASGIANPFFAVHEGSSGATARIDGRELANFANYNYLGLSGHPEVSAAAQSAIARYGTSVSASRVVSGERALHRELEAAIARFIGVEDSVTFVGGHATNVSTIGHLFGAQDLVLCDELAHNSIMQGAAFSGARRLVFPHNDTRALDEILGELRGRYRRALIAIEGIYSADGDIPDLAAFLEVKRRHRAMLLVDEAHSIGVLGATGRGLAEHAGVDPGAVDIWMGTLSKALASCGGYIAGSAILARYLRYTAPGFVFSVGMTPPNAAAALAALRVLEREPQRVQALRENARMFLSLLRERGVNTGRSGGTPIVPAVVGDSALAMQLSQMLQADGVNVQPMVAPAVADDAARLRFFVAATHDAAQLRRAADALASAITRTSRGSAAATPLQRGRPATPRAERAVVHGSLALAPDPAADE